MDMAESVAKRVLDAIIPGANLEYQSEQSNGEYDFNLHCADGTTAAVEITAAIDERHLEMLAAIYDRRRGDRIIRPTACKKSWIIFPAISASINKIRANADRYLARLEQEGNGSFFCVSARTPSTRQICRELRIAFGSVLNSDCEPMIEIGRPIGAGAVGPRLAIKTGEAKAWKEDNRKKLGSATTAERHLVVYIPAGSLAWSALTNFEPPATLPKLPREITNLWLIGQSGRPDEFLVWYASTNEIWRSAKVACTPETSRIQDFDEIR
jgi:hypothetical protein